MLLIVELVLTAVAWRRGWRARALWPLAGGVAAGFIVGLLVAAAGGSPSAAMGIGLLFDLACVAVLVVMAIRGYDDPYALPTNFASAESPYQYPSRQGSIITGAERTFVGR